MNETQTGPLTVETLRERFAALNNGNSVVVGRRYPHYVNVDVYDETLIAGEVYDTDLYLVHSDVRYDLVSRTYVADDTLPRALSVVLKAMGLVPSTDISPEAAVMRRAGY